MCAGISGPFRNAADKFGTAGNAANAFKVVLWNIGTESLTLMRTSSLIIECLD